MLSNNMYYRMQQMNEDFYIFVNVEEIALRLNLDESVVDIIFVYWKLKRKVVNFNIFCIYNVDIS